MKRLVKERNNQFVNGVQGERLREMGREPARQREAKKESEEANGEGE